MRAYSTQHISKLEKNWQDFLDTPENKLKNKTRPTKVFYKKKWRLICWKPCIVVNGKAVTLDKFHNNISQKDNNGGRRTKEWK